MRKIVKKVLAVALALAMTVQPVALKKGQEEVKAAGVADQFTIPAADANGRVGAKMPYTRYDSTDAVLSGGAILKTSTDWNPNNIATQASAQSYVGLPGSGSSVEWTMKTTGAGVTMRFTLPDGNGGTGVKGSLDVYVNNKKVKTVKLDSFWMWQYFNFGSGSPSDSAGAIGAFAFDEVHFLLDTPLKSGDKIKIQSTGAGGYEYGVDFLEIEDVPEAIEQPDNSVSVEEYGAVAYGEHGDRDTFDAAIASKNTAAFKQAVADADKKGMDLYIPEGTYLLDGMWTIGAENMKITGAGIWYTNIQFTSEEVSGGGVSGGNPNAKGSTVADGYCKNVEFCNMYLNSGLRSRHNEQAIYKCFMDIWADGSVIHDIWEEHFECGFWFGDYNGKIDYCDGVKVVNSRIRNNLADGVNFCQGTSNAVVYNCSVRNNGDDGLAMWNDQTMGAKDEVNNVFAYNTIDLGWRAGLLAIYGGQGHKVYNNYLCDSFMAAGIHFNTTFPGYKFSGSTPNTFDNNILVRCGTPKECWGRDYAAIDFEQEVKNIVFNNTQIYDSPFTAIRLLGTSYSNITFNDTTILGAGLSKQISDFSSSGYSGAAIRENANSSAVFNGLTVGAVVSDQTGKNTSTWPFYTDNATPKNLAGNDTVTLLDDDVTYEVPGYPEADTSQGGGVIDPLDGITGYDVALAGLSWKNESNSSSIEEGDKVTFTTAVKNTSNVDIPEGVAIQIKITVDGKGSYTNTTYKGGLKAGETIKLSPTSTWTATAGGHTIEATVDYRNKLPNELSKDNNTRSKSFNVQEAPDREPTYTPVTGRYDIQVLDVTWDKEIINVGDALTFTATIVNAGDTAIPAGQKLGVQFQIDGNPYPSPITWNDQYFDGLQPGQVIKLTATGGNSGSSWTATTGSHTVTAWADDSNVFGEMNETNNKYTKTITVPYGGVQYIENPDKPDDLDNTGEIEQPTEKPTETPTEPGTETVVTSKDVNVVGYQISSTLKGSRVVASVEPTVNGKNVVKHGLVYALTKLGDKDTGVKNIDMTVSADNYYVASFESTNNGNVDKVFGSSKTAQYYVMTTLFENQTVQEYTAKYKVRAYAVLSDGSYVYSDIYSYSVYNVASALYDGGKMPTNADHTYLYDSILKLVNPSYKQVDYDWSDIVTSL